MEVVAKYHGSSEIIERMVWCTFTTKAKLESLINEDLKDKKTLALSRLRKHRIKTNSILRARRAKQKVILHHALEEAQRITVQKAKNELRCELTQSVVSICSTILGNFFAAHKYALSKQATTLMQKTLLKSGITVRLSPIQRESIIASLADRTLAHEESSLIIPGDIEIKSLRTKISTSWRREVTSLAELLTERILENMERSN